MSRLNGAIFLGAAALAAAAPASAQQWHTTTVDLPDGSVAEIEYAGDIPPRVTVSVPVVEDIGEAEAADYEYEAENEYEAAALPVATRARRVIQPPPASVAPYAAAPRLVVTGDAPEGSTYEYTLITTGADGRVCSQRTEWRSRGRGKEPDVRLTDEGEGCAVTNGAAQSALPPEPPVSEPTVIPRPQIVPIDPDAI